MNTYTDVGGDLDRLAWKSARVYCTIACCIIPIATLTWINEKVDIIWPWYLSFLICVACAIITYRYDKMPTKYVAWVFLSTSISAFIANSVVAHCIVTQRLTAEFFGAYRTIAIIIALLAPQPAWIGYLIITLCLFIPPLQVLLITPEIFNYGVHREPWMAMVYSISAFGILKYRLESHKVYTSLIESKANEKALGDFADVAVALRDLMNTPIQSLEILGELLKNEKISYREASNLLRQSTYKIREITNIFNEHQKKLRWRSGQESLDSLEILKLRFSSSADQKNRDSKNLTSGS